MKGNQSEKKGQQDENLRAEYAALSNYFNKLITFRLTLLGFYLAAIGLIVAGTNWPISLPISLLGIVLTVSLYIFELRTRVIFRHLAKRAIAIEQVNWHFKGQKDAIPFFSRQFYDEVIKDKENGDKFPTEIQILGIKIRIPYRGSKVSALVSYSFALDILYLGVLIFFIVSAVSNYLNILEYIGIYWNIIVEWLLKVS